MAKTAFMEWEHFLTNTPIHTETRMRILHVECYSQQVLLHGAETWKISIKMEKGWRLKKCGLYEECWRYLGQRGDKWRSALADTSRKLIKKDSEILGHKLRKQWTGKLTKNGKIQFKQSKRKIKINFYKQHAIKNDGSEVSGWNDTRYRPQK